MNSLVRHYYLVQLIEHPFLQILNYNFPNLRCCKVVFFLSFSYNKLYWHFWMYFDINSKLLSGKNTQKVNKQIFGICKILKIKKIFCYYIIDIKYYFEKIDANLRTQKITYNSNQAGKVPNHMLQNIKNKPQVKGHTLIRQESIACANAM